MTEETIFSKIIAGEVPCTKIYEDEAILAFLDINPIQIGHTLVIPKSVSIDALEASDEDMAAVMNVAQKVARALKQALGCNGINFIMSNGKAAGQEVWHSHLHVIPRYEGDGVQFPNVFSKYETDEQKHEVGQAIKAAL